MRGRQYLFIYILALLFVMFNIGVYADDGTLSFRNEPTFAQLDDPESRIITDDADFLFLMIKSASQQYLSDMVTQTVSYRLP